MATTTTTSPVDSELERSPATPRRIAAAAAVAVGLGLFFTVAAIDVPHAAGDAELLRWWQEKSNRTAGIVSGMAAVGVALSFPIVAGYLFQLRSAARAPHWRYFARSMVTAVTALWLVTGAVRAAIGRFVDVSNEPLFGPDTLRLATALNYSLLGLSGMAVLSLAILSISVLVLRAQGPRPLGRVRRAGLWVAHARLRDRAVRRLHDHPGRALGLLPGGRHLAWSRRHRLGLSRTMTGWRTGRGTSGSCRLSPSTAPRTSTTWRSR